MLSQLLFFFASSGSFLRSSLKSARLLLSFEITFALGGGAFLAREGRYLPLSAS